MAGARALPLARQRPRAAERRRADRVASRSATIDRRRPPAARCARRGEPLLPTRERRRQIADDLYDALVPGGYSFWEHIHPLFLSRDITRTTCASWSSRAEHDARQLPRAARLFGIPSGTTSASSISSTHDCQVDYREFRTARHEAPHSRRSILTLLPPLKEEPAGADASSGGGPDNCPGPARRAQSLACIFNGLR